MSAASTARISGAVRSWGPPALFAATFLSCVYQLTRNQLAFGSYFETLNVAKSLAETGSFSNPFTAAPTGPTAHLAPLFPALLAALIRLLGYRDGFAILATALMIAAVALQAALLPSISELLFHSQLPGLWAGAMAVVLPLFQIASPGECLFVGPFLLLFFLASSRLADQWGAVRGGLAAGLFAGFLVLWSPASVVVVAIGCLWVSVRFQGREKARFALAAAAAALAVCAPWTIRNYVTLGGPVFVRDNLGLELHIANNDHAAPTLAENMKNGSLPRLHPNFNPAETRRVIELGELRYNRACLAAAWEWARSNPQRFLRLTEWRVLRFWFPEPAVPPYAWALWLVTALSAPGLIVAVRRKEPAAWILGAILLFYPTLYYLTQADDRYRYPVVWVSLLLAGYALAALQRIIKAARQ